MSPSSTVHGGKHDTKYVTFELLLHAAFVADNFSGYMLEPARRKEENETDSYMTFGVRIQVFCSQHDQIKM